MFLVSSTISKLDGEKKVSSSENSQINTHFLKCSTSTNLYTEASLVGERLKDSEHVPLCPTANYSIPDK